MSRLKMPPSFTNVGLADSDWDVLCDTIFPNAQDPEVIVKAVRYCQARRLDVFKKPVMIVPMWSSTYKKHIETVWMGIHELLTTASRTGKFAGQDDTVYGPDMKSDLDGLIKVKDEWVRKRITITHPEWAKVVVYRMVDGNRVPFTSDKVFWLETYAKMGNQESRFPSPAWIERPRMQLAKCALAAAIRVAFPDQGEYCAEEMEGRTVEGMSVKTEVITAEILDAVGEIPVLPEDFDMSMIRPAANDFIVKAIKRAHQVNAYKAAASLMKERLQGVELAYGIDRLTDSAEIMASTNSVGPSTETTKH